MRALLLSGLLVSGPALGCAPFCPPPPPPGPDVGVWTGGGWVSYPSPPGVDFEGWDVNGDRHRRELELERQRDLDRDVDWWDTDED